MKEHPILFSTPMVQAILEDRKTQTRRIIKPQPEEGLIIDIGGVHSVVNGNQQGPLLFGAMTDDDRYFCKCPYGKPGDVLWVRESFNIEQYPVGPEGDHDELLYYYKATEKEFTDMRWKPSIHMPKDACRIWLEVLNIKVERLQDISREDCISEGIEGNDYAYKNYIAISTDTWPYFVNPYTSYASLWYKINGEESWNANPWVWVIEFKVLSKTRKT